MDCVFCKIVSGDLPSTIEYQDEDVLAFRDIHPSAPVHVLVIPKKHIASLEIATESDILGNLQIVIAKLIDKLKIANYKVVVNGGSFQDIKHLHYHLLSGFSDPDKNF